jgi:hypothetical protein
MNGNIPEFGLPDGWTGSVELQKSADGCFAGKAELREGRDARCVFVLTQQPTREAAYARAKVHAEQFVAEWALRQRERVAPRLKE